MHVEKFTELMAIYLPEEWERQQHQGYAFLVRNGVFSHSAFYTLSEFAFWMKFRGLDFGDAWNLNINKNVVRLTPGYRTIMTLDTVYFAEVKKQYKDVVPFMSNARYTEAVRVPPLPDDEEGLVTLVYLNPNVERVESLNRFDKDLVVGLLEGIYG